MRSSGINAPISAPINVCGNAIAVLGSAQAGCKGGATVTSVTTPNHPGRPGHPGHPATGRVPRTTLARACAVLPL